MMNLNKTFLVSICALMAALGTSAQAMNAEDMQILDAMGRKNMRLVHQSATSRTFFQQNVAEQKPSQSLSTFSETVLSSSLPAQAPAVLAVETDPATEKALKTRTILAGRGLVLPEGLSNEEVQVYGRFVEVMTSYCRWADFVRSPSSLNDFITKSLEMFFKEGGKQYKRKTSAQATPSDANPTLISVLRNVIAWKENKDNASVLSQIKAELTPRLTVLDIIPVEQVFSKKEIQRSVIYEGIICERAQQLCANPYTLAAEIKRLEKEFPVSAEIYKALAPIKSTHEAIKKARELNLPNPEEVVKTLPTRFIELRSMYYTYEELVLKGGLKKHMQEFSDKAQASYWNAFDAYSALNASTAAE